MPTPSPSRLLRPARSGSSGASADCRRGLMALSCCAVIAAVIASRRLAPRRFVVADRSMEPTLVDGQGLVAVRSNSARMGQLRTFEHPDRPGFWLVKRVTAVSDGSMIVESDNREIATEDSLSFGPVDISGSYRVAVRVPRRWM